MDNQSDKSSRKYPISEIDLRIRQLEERKRKIAYTDSQKERKKRANRLIQTGALVEKYFECSHLSLEEKEELFSIFSTYINANKPDKFKPKDDYTNK